ncbi:MAG: hypothetical protein J7L89_01935 [Bacteroidales bacterium]|nr:hypothetical protein [Bacteroidales bacterium]
MARGKPLIQWVYQSVNSLSDEVLIAANEGDFSSLNARIIPDRIKGIGPITGIESGLHAAVFSCSN